MKSFPKQVSESVYKQVKSMLRNHSAAYIHNRTTISLSTIEAIKNDRVNVVVKPKVEDFDYWGKMI